MSKYLIILASKEQVQRRTTDVTLVMDAITYTGASLLLRFPKVEVEKGWNSSSYLRYLRDKCQRRNGFWNNRERCCKDKSRTPWKRSETLHPTMDFWTASASFPVVFPAQSHAVSSCQSNSLALTHWPARLRSSLRITSNLSLLPLPLQKEHCRKKREITGVHESIAVIFQLDSSTAPCGEQRHT